MPCRCFEIEVGTVGEQVNIGVAADDFRQPFPDVLLPKAHDLSYPLQGETLAPKPADHRDVGEFLQGIEAAMALAFGPYDATLVPILELAGRDPGKGNYFLRWKTILHSSPNMFETIFQLNV